MHRTHSINTSSLIHFYILKKSVLFSPKNIHSCKDHFPHQTLALKHCKYAAVYLQSLNTWIGSIHARNSVFICSNVIVFCNFLSLHSVVISPAWYNLLFDTLYISNTIYIQYRSEEGFIYSSLNQNTAKHSAVIGKSRSYLVSIK